MKSMFVDSIKFIQPALGITPKRFNTINILVSTAGLYFSLYAVMFLDVIFQSYQVLFPVTHQIR